MNNANDASKSHALLAEKLLGDAEHFHSNLTTGDEGTADAPGNTTSQKAVASFYKSFPEKYIN